MNEKGMSPFNPFKIPPDPWLALNEQLGYEKAFQTEVKDGLIALDVRTVDTPPFDQWLRNDHSFQNREKSSSFEFHWNMASANLLVEIEVSISASIDQTRNSFRDMISAVVGSNPDRRHKPWKPCNKQIGTVCARTAIKTMFVYKNVFITTYVVPILPDWDAKSHGRIGDWVDESLLPKSPSGEPWDEVLAEWFFGVLKNAPRYKTFPPEPIPLK